MRKMIRALALRTYREEDGIAMIIAVVLSSVIVTLAVMSMTVANHADKAAARGRHWVQALHVAESGVEKAIAKIEQSGVYTGTITGSTAEGTYTVSVTHDSRMNYTLTATGAVRQGRQLSATRKLRVTLSPPASFKYALFSNTSVVTKNNDRIEGDIWANQNAVVTQGTVVTGSITGATGYVHIDNGSRVDKDVTAGGFNPATNYAVHLSTNGIVGGNATASVVNPPDPITCGGANPNSYTVRLDSGAVINGWAKSWGSKTGPGNVAGGATNNICLPAPATIPLPTFTYSPSNYDPATLREFGTPTTPSANAVTDFNNWVNAQPGKQISGTFYVNQSGAVNQSTKLDLTGTTIVGDLTIITNTPIFSNGTADTVSPEKIAVLISSYKPPTGTICSVDDDLTECSIRLKNNFQTGCATAILAYAPFGPTAIKNNQEACGAVYSDSIEIMNNQTLKYDARVERVVGFGPRTLEINRWLEVRV